MKKVININFQGRVVPIEETAYDILNQYVESLRRYFANEEGKDEIINDIEGRIAELFAETLKKGSTCITEADVNAIITSMGRPEDFEAEEASVQTQLGAGRKQSSAGAGASTAQPETESATGTRTANRLYRDENNKLLGGVCAGIANYFGIDRLIVRILFILGFGITFIPYLILWVAVPSSASTVIGSVRKRLFRDPDNKIIAGVCGGLASYFGVNAWIPRVLFLIPFFSFVTNWSHWGFVDLPTFFGLSFSPGSILVYIILWLVIPEAQTTSDKLEMKGEKVDLNSIRNTIQGDMEGFKDRAQQFGKEVGQKAQEFGSTIGERGKKFSAEASSVAGTAVRKTSTGLGDIIALIFKIFAYFIVAVVLFALVVSLFGIGIAFTGMLPIKRYFINEGWQNLFVWGALILFIWVPVIGIITWIIRRIAKAKSNSNTLRTTFIALWLLGLFCVIGLITSLSRDFQYHNTPAETSVSLNNPTVDKLELRHKTDTRYYVNSSWLHLEPFATVDQDTVIIKNVRLRILKADDSLFHVTTMKLSSGSSRQEAERRAASMRYNIRQRDTLLEFDRGFPITPEEKFRNQTVYVSVYVPVGKRILVDDNVGWSDNFHIGFGWDLNDWEWRYQDNNDYNWQSDVEYIMTESGLKRVHPEKDWEEDEERNNRNNDERLNDSLRQLYDSLRNSDSTRYRFEPAENERPKKIDVKASIVPQKVKPNISVDFHDLASTFVGRATI